MALTPAGILLAGGHSRRMGRDKALLPVPGSESKTFVEHLSALLAAFCSEVVLVARDAEQAADYAHVGVRILTDEISDVGPLMGLYSGLRAMTASHALVIAVDMPFVQPGIVRLLLAQPLDDALLVPVVDGFPQVLCAVYPRSLLPTIEERLRAGRRDPRSLLEVAGVRMVDEAQLRAVDPQLRSFVNVNTPDEFARSCSANNL
jgi:molybdopterin-guanine dinucleotide biosynthesis protein A